MKNLVLSFLFMSASSFAAELPKDLAAIVDKLDSECAGNDSGTVRKFDPKKFDAAAIMKDLKADQTGTEGTSDCRSTFSSNKAEGVAALLYTLFDKASYEYDCVGNALTKTEAKKLRKLITDPKNLGVFSKEWDGEGGDSEYCQYSNYDIYRADGNMIRIVFNHTDRFLISKQNNN